MILTQDQQQALSGFNDFLNSDNNVFILRGAAGTGKTTVLTEFIKLLMSKSAQFSIMAPTGRAALVSRERTGYDAKTIHRSIYALDKQPEIVNERYIYALRENDETTNHNYFVDEASMVSDVYSENELFIFGSGFLLRDLFTYCKIKESKRKIVFIGDYIQLPPVNQNFSPALNVEYLSENYSAKSISATLTEVVRQGADSMIVNNAQCLREAVENNRFTDFHMIDGSDFVKVDVENFIEKYTDVAHSDSVENCVVVTYSNAKALEYNNIIRKIRYKKENLPIRRKDLLLITQNNYSNDIILYNGTIVVVESVDNNIETHIAFVGNTRCELTFRDISFIVEGEEISQLILDDFAHNQDISNEIERNILIQKALWSDFEQRMRKEEIKSKSDEFKIKIRTDKYYHALQWKYGYAITCHKAQGGEWKNVFVDMDCAGGKRNEDYFRWVYTAITRAKSALYHISSPDFKESDMLDFKEMEICNEKAISYWCPNGVNFLDYYYDILKRECEAIDVDCIEDRSANYQHRIIFTRKTDGVSCKLSLWYSSKGYNRRIESLNSKNEEFTTIIKNIVSRLAPDDDILYTPKFERVGYVKEILIKCASECDLVLVNIEQKEWCDIFFFVTDHGVFIMDLHFNKKGICTMIMPKKSNKVSDNVNIFIELLKLEIYG